jgi:hypothetical protein
LSGVFDVLNGRAVNVEAADDYGEFVAGIERTVHGADLIWIGRQYWDETEKEGEIT